MDDDAVRDGFGQEKDAEEPVCIRGEDGEARYAIPVELSLPVASNPLEVGAERTPEDTVLGGGEIPSVQLGGGRVEARVESGRRRGGGRIEVEIEADRTPVRGTEFRQFAQRLPRHTPRCNGRRYRF